MAAECRYLGIIVPQNFTYCAAEFGKICHGKTGVLVMVMCTNFTGSTEYIKPNKRLTLSVCVCVWASAPPMSMHDAACSLQDGGGSPSMSTLVAANASLHNRPNFRGSNLSVAPMTTVTGVNMSASSDSQFHQLFNTSTLLQQLLP